jgi:hypothetical protein
MPNRANRKVKIQNELTKFIIDYAPRLAGITTRIRHNAKARAFVRTITPLVVALASSDAIVALFGDLPLEGILLGFFSIYYSGALHLEKKFPRLGFFLLGAKGSPGYSVEDVIGSDFYS